MPSGNFISKYFICYFKGVMATTSHKALDANEPMLNPLST